MVDSNSGGIRLAKDGEEEEERTMGDCQKNGVGNRTLAALLSEAEGVEESEASDLGAGQGTTGSGKGGSETDGVNTVRVVVEEEGKAEGH